MAKTDNPLGKEFKTWKKLGEWVDKSPLNISAITIKKYSSTGKSEDLVQIVSISLSIPRKDPLSEYRVVWEN